MDPVVRARQLLVFSLEDLGFKFKDDPRYGGKICSKEDRYSIGKGEEGVDFIRLDDAAAVENLIHSDMWRTAVVGDRVVKHIKQWRLDEDGRLPVGALEHLRGELAALEEEEDDDDDDDGMTELAPGGGGDGAVAGAGENKSGAGNVEDGGDPMAVDLDDGAEERSGENVEGDVVVGVDSTGGGGGGDDYTEAGGNVDGNGNKKRKLVPAQTLTGACLEDIGKKWAAKLSGVKGLLRELVVKKCPGASRSTMARYLSYLKGLIDDGDTDLEPELDEYCMELNAIGLEALETIDSYVVQEGYKDEEKQLMADGYKVRFGLVGMENEAANGAFCFESISSNVIKFSSSFGVPEMNLSQLDQSWAEQQMAINAIGPIMLTSKLAPLLKARKGRKNYLRESGARESVVVNLSARVASMGDNTGGLSWYTYRMSKAALNAGVRASAHELRRQGTWQVGLYPGMTDTDMSKPFQSKQMVDKGLVFPVEFTVGRLLDVVDRMEEENSGGFYDWAGQAIPF